MSVVAGSGQSWESAARRALDAVQRDPRTAIRIGQSVLEGSDCPPASAVAARALGLAHRELNELGAAVAHLRRAVRLAQRCGSTELTALARMSLGYVLANSGHNVAA